jgi:hypothetical protein
VSAPFSRGAAHDLVGTGELSIAEPIGLEWIVTSFPAYVARQPGTPERVAEVGRFAVGTATAWLPEREPGHIEQLEYPLPAGLTALGYSLDANVTATVTELISTAPGDLLARNPVPIGHVYVVDNRPGTTNGIAFTYTVPAGKLLLLNSARVEHQRYAAMPAATGGLITGLVEIVNVMSVIRSWLAVPESKAVGEWTGDLILSAGWIVRGVYVNVEGSGGAYTSIGFHGTLIDA